MRSKAWWLWGIVIALVSLGVWYIPSLAKDSWWGDNSKWIALGIFGIFLVLFAPFLAWRNEYHLRLNAKDELTQLRSNDMEQQRRERELRIRQMEQEEHPM